MERLVYDNVFESLVDDKDEAADLSFRASLISALVDLFEDRGWKQADVAEALGIPQPRVSELMRGKVHLFSADRLIGYWLASAFASNHPLNITESYVMWK